MNDREMFNRTNDPNHRPHCTPCPDGFSASEPQRWARQTKYCSEFSGICTTHGGQPTGLPAAKFRRRLNRHSVLEQPSQPGGTRTRIQRNVALVSGWITSRIQAMANKGPISGRPGYLDGCWVEPLPISCRQSTSFPTSFRFLDNWTIW